MSKVLIVDDEESICWGLRRLLTEEGYDVTTVASAEERSPRSSARHPIWRYSTCDSRASTD
ncbi:MAG: response regulator [Pirellulales bacterium]